jgi:TonB family protein
MSQGVFGEVFTADEVARAAGVDVRLIRQLMASGDIPTVAGSGYIAGADAIAAGRRLRSGVGVKPISDLPAEAGRHSLLDPPAESGSHAFLVASAFGRKDIPRRSGMPALASSLVHATAIGLVLWLTAGATETAPVDEWVPRQSHLVFLMAPGPGGGGGGGGLRSPLPPRRVERKAAERPRPSVPNVTPKPVATTARPETPKEPTPPPAPVPKPVERAPEPLPARAIVAPVVNASADTRDREGVLEESRTASNSQGPGAGSGAGAGQGIGSGNGSGAGLGDGSGGGTGGGPYRAGSGIEPPRLLREVKAEYTDEGRRRGITGEVLLEIVVQRDGSVGQVTTVRGLGAGLDQSAVAAVRQWRFAPARRQGAPVDVIVQVAVDFTLR